MVLKTKKRQQERERAEMQFFLTFKDENILQFERKVGREA